jgi:hypothetical protein
MRGPRCRLLRTNRGQTPGRSWRTNYMQIKLSLVLALRHWLTHYLHLRGSISRLARGESSIFKFANFPPPFIDAPFFCATVFPCVAQLRPPRAILIIMAYYYIFRGTRFDLNSGFNKKK